MGQNLQPGWEQAPGKPEIKKVQRGFGKESQHPEIPGGKWAVCPRFRYPIL